MNVEMLKVLANRGIIVDPMSEIMEDGWREDHNLALDALSKITGDAAPVLITSPNAGVPAYLLNLLDPKVIRVLVTPMKAAEVYGEQQRGSWTTLTAQFPMAEATGTVSSYNDYSQDGSASSNYNWVPRQSYHFQTNTRWGDRETAMYGEAQLNYVSDLNYGSALALSKFLNSSYFFGVEGLMNYGGLNDPSLPAPISPVIKAGTGTTWAVATAVEVYNDVLLLFEQLQSQLNGLIDRDTPLTLALSPTVEPNMGKVTAYTLAPVRQAIKENWPNMKIVTAQEFATASGQLMQMIVDELDGDDTAYACFTEKMRAGRIVSKTSSFEQKKSSGTFGTVIRRPICFAQMLGL